MSVALYPNVQVPQSKKDKAVFGLCWRDSRSGMRATDPETNAEIIDLMGFNLSTELWDKTGDNLVKYEACLALYNEILTTIETAHVAHIYFESFKQASIKAVQKATF